MIYLDSHKTTSIHKTSEQSSTIILHQRSLGEFVTCNKLKKNFLLMLLQYDLQAHTHTQND